VKRKESLMATEEEALVSNWLVRLESFGVSRKDFDAALKQLSEQFGKPAGVNDTVWRILNELVPKYARDAVTLERVYKEMASLVSKEEKDPTPYLLEAEKARQKRIGRRPERRGRTFLGHDRLAYVAKLRNEGKLDQAEELLMEAEPSPAVLDELRKIVSTRARRAKKDGDWQIVVQYLEGYTAYAQECREHCVRLANQEPPNHTRSDTKLLQEAKAKLAG
jgi:hypothetical protein